MTALRKLSIDALARELLSKAEGANSGRAAETVYGGSEMTLRQTVVALTAGIELAEHDNPGEATIQVLFGRIRLIAEGHVWDGRQGTLLIVPNARHSVIADTAAAIILTVVKARA